MPAAAAAAPCAWRADADRKSCGRALIMVLISGLSAAWAQDAAQPPTFLDDLEFRMEIGQHERLVKTSQ